MTKEEKLNELRAQIAQIKKELGIGVQPCNVCGAESVATAYPYKFFCETHRPNRQKTG